MHRIVVKDFPCLGKKQIGNGLDRTFLVAVIIFRCNGVIFVEKLVVLG